MGPLTSCFQCGGENVGLSSAKQNALEKVKILLFISSNSAPETFISQGYYLREGRRENEKSLV